MMDLQSGCGVREVEVMTMVFPFLRMTKLYPRLLSVENLLENGKWNAEAYLSIQN
jgi:hypothetical protein